MSLSSSHHPSQESHGHCKAADPNNMQDWACMVVESWTILNFDSTHQFKMWIQTIPWNGGWSYRDLRPGPDMTTPFFSSMLQGQFVPLRLRVRAFFQRWPGALKARYLIILSHYWHMVHVWRHCKMNPKLEETRSNISLLWVVRYVVYWSFRSK